MSCRRTRHQTAVPCKFLVVPQSSWELGLRNQPSSSAGTQGRVGKWCTQPWGFLQHLSTFLNAECDPHTSTREGGWFFFPFYSPPFIYNCQAYPLGSFWASLSTQTQFPVRLTPLSIHTALESFKRQSLLIPFFILSWGLCIPVHFHTVSLLSWTAPSQRQSLEGTMQTVLQKLTSLR